MWGNKKKQEGLIALIEGDNVNVSTKGDGKSFIKLVFAVCCMVLLLFGFLGIIGDVYIETMSDETQKSIEEMFKQETDYSKYTPQQKKNVEKLKQIRNKIVAISPELQNKSPFNIGIDPAKEVNAYIYPDGTIYFTEGILKENLDSKELTFVMAHELGHYANRDSLKSINRQIILMGILLFLNGNDAARSIANGAGNAGALSYSRSQELDADLYASKKLKKLYGNNKAAINFINRLRESEEDPDFVDYFSTHPSWDLRLEYIQDDK